MVCRDGSFGCYDYLELNRHCLTTKSYIQSGELCDFKSVCRFKFVSLSMELRPHNNMLFFHREVPTAVDLTLAPIILLEMSEVSESAVKGSRE